ncbi:hypothetical protein [Cecembia rubra]|uniref:hypothetical protein n=1 Tax=Cecembia rubra TaxID=1485585 RepID=UPI002714D8B1|nr:hypothetical protein [Cecembia rubra]
MKKFQFLVVFVGFYMAVNSANAQSGTLEADIDKLLVLQIQSQMNLNDATFRNKGNESIKEMSRFQKGTLVESDIVAEDLEIVEPTYYPMPFKNLNGNYKMQIYIPDSSINYTIQIKELGLRFDGFKK